MNFSISKNNFIKFSNSYKEKGAKGAFLDLIRWTKNRIKLIFNIKDSIHKRREYLSKKIHLLIGPEGDFSKEEVQKALKNKIQAVSLGENRLRTETAGLISAHSLLLKLKEHL